MPEHIHEGLERVLAGHNPDFAQRPGLIKADMIPRAGKQLGRLLDPVVQHLIHARIARVVFFAIARQPQVGVFLEAEHIVHVAVKLHARDDIYMALARVFDDLPDLVARIAAIGIDHVVAFELNAGLGIEVGTGWP